MSGGEGDTVAGPAIPVLTVRVPGTPPRALWGNSSAHWGTRAKAAAAARRDAGLAARAALGPSPAETGARFRAAAGGVRLDVTIAWPPRQRRLDDDGAIRAIKAMRDGIADALAIDDRRFWQASMAQTWDRTGGGYVEFRVRAAPAGDGEGR